MFLIYFYLFIYFFKGGGGISVTNALSCFMLAVKHFNFSVILAISENGSCSDGWKFTSRKCYLFSWQLSNIYAASSFCNSRQSKLATVQSQNDYSFFKLTYDYDRFWIGLIRTPNSTSGILCLLLRRSCL